VEEYVHASYPNPEPEYRDGDLVERGLSDDDPMSSVRAKLEEYRAWGVLHVWLADPRGRRLYECDAGLHEVDVLRLPDLGIEVTPADAFD